MRPDPDTRNQLLAAVRIDAINQIRAQVQSRIDKLHIAANVMIDLGYYEGEHKAAIDSAERELSRTRDVLDRMILLESDRA